ncbi:MAG: hypothetical protein QOE61_5324 [Micromonosporaceae bacterium]|jgi:hypothetical protein|nr:hypothetical protein [Micromonosporaceae bacterium]
MRDWIMRDRWLTAVGTVVAGVIVLALSWKVGAESWWSGALVNAGTALVLFAPFLLFGRHIEQRFNEVRVGQAQIEERQVATSASMATLAEEVSSTQVELRRTREELKEAVASRRAATRQRDRTAFADVEAAPSHDVLFTVLVRAAELNLTTAAGCRVPVDNTNLFLRFETPTTYDRFQDAPDPEEDLYLRLEHIDGTEAGRLSWPKEQTAEDFLFELSEAVVKVGHYPGDNLFDASRVLGDLRELLELAYESATGGSVEPLTGVVQFCPPQWVITERALVSTGKRTGYLIPLTRIREDWSRQMSGKPWIDQDSFDTAMAAASALYEARRMAAKPPGFDEEIPF